jgi:hypothetical protein
MFNAKQTQLLNTLGIVSDAERYLAYENYCEIQFELRANGIRSSTTFTRYLERKVAFKVSQARENADKTLAQLA